jgi:hypothetical protein
LFRFDQQVYPMLEPAGPSHRGSRR